VIDPFPEFKFTIKANQTKEEIAHKLKNGTFIYEDVYYGKIYTHLTPKPILKGIVLTKLKEIKAE
jgi:hypothetical protein